GVGGGGTGGLNRVKGAVDGGLAVGDTTEPRQRGLVTGMRGPVGGALRRRLEGQYELFALNRRSVDGVACHRADIADLAAIEPAFRGIDVVVHLAAVARGGAPWAEVLAHNVIGTYNVFEASRRGG